MKKLLALALSLTLAFSLTACGGGGTSSSGSAPESGSSTSSESEGEKSFAGVKILHLISNTRGDGGNHDAAAAAVEKMRDEYGAEIKIVEMGNSAADVPKYLPTTLDACEEGWDYIVCGTAQMVEPVMEASNEFPDQKFIVYDAEIVRESEDQYPNVYSCLFKQNEASFLAGAMAAQMSDTGKIGFIGGMEIPAINDFLVGYIDGARYINPDIEVYSAFVGSWNDVAKCKEIANTQYQQGASLVFPAAGQAYPGAFEAGLAAQKMYLGCDVDRSISYKETNPEICEYMPTSVLKFVGNSIEGAFLRIMEGENIFGKHETVGIAENCVGLAENEYYEKLVPEEVRTKLDEIKADIVSGKIVVKSAYGMSQDELNAFKNA